MYVPDRDYDRRSSRIFPLIRIGVSRGGAIITETSTSISANRISPFVFAEARDLGVPVASRKIATARRIESNPIVRDKKSPRRVYGKTSAFFFRRTAPGTLLRYFHFTNTIYLHAKDRIVIDVSTMATDDGYA